MERACTGDAPACVIYDLLAIVVAADATIGTFEPTFGIILSIPFTIGDYNSNVGPISYLANRGEKSHGVSINGSALEDYSLRYDVTSSQTEHCNYCYGASTVLRRTALVCLMITA